MITATLNPPDIPDAATVQQQAFLFMREEYMEILKAHITGLLMWNLQVFPRLAAGSVGMQDGMIPVTEGGLSSSPPVRRCRKAQPESTNGNPQLSGRNPRNNIPTEIRTRGFYCSVIVWYVMKNAGFVLESENVKAEIWKCLKQFDSVNNEDNQANTVSVGDALGCILRWFHSHSVIKIYEMIRAEDPSYSGPTTVNIERHRVLADHWGAKAGKSLRLFGQGRFARQTIGHELANLAALSLEIGAEDRPAAGLGMRCLDYIKEHIRGRRDTARVESGAPNVQRWDAAHTVKSAMPRPAPWELSCLAHYLPVTLDIASDGLDSECLSDCREFLLADYTFIPSWDYSKAGAVGLWWDLTTSSIICSRFLDEISRDREAEAFRKAHDQQDSDFPREADTKAIAPPKIDLLVPEQKAITENLKAILNILEQLKRGKVSEEVEGYTWKKRRPNLRYHADTSVQSLEDTPQVYKIKQTHNIKLRPNFRRFMRENCLKPPNWTLIDIPETLPAVKLRHISVLDFTLSGTNNDPEILLSTIRGEADRSWEKDASQVARLTKVLKENPGLWDLYFLNGYETQPIAAQPRNGGGDLLCDLELRKTFFQSYQQSLFRVLNDSVSLHQSNLGCISNF